MKNVVIGLLDDVEQSIEFVRFGDLQSDGDSPAPQTARLITAVPGLIAAMRDRDPEGTTAILQALEIGPTNDGPPARTALEL